ncbi:MAG TPA: Rieske (2Fe-2S) protein [Mucilaginibacter sp.]|jgi:cytochrome b6-f complex iron-sulfur subunit|nr:Rieske (2Fe-2S) protein [Mucilaginibacter sp.]
MEREEFLKLIGAGTTSIALFYCASCSKHSENPAITGPSGVNFTLDLTDPANASLLNIGGSLAKNGVLVARTSSGSYIAVQQSCTHESFSLIYHVSAQLFLCNKHGAAFNENGIVVNPPATKNLTVYNTKLTGNLLAVYS